MEFDAAGEIQQKYSPILGSGELAWKLAVRFHTFHCEENRTPENLEMEFKSLLVDLGWERKLDLLADMFGRAEGNEKGFVMDALREGLRKCAINGYVLAPANLLGRDLPPELMKEAEDAAAEGAAMARRAGNLGEASVLLNRASTPWRIADIICRECAGTSYFTRIADLFARDGMPVDTHIIAMDALFSSVDEIEKIVRAEIRKIDCAGLAEKEAEERKREARKPMGLVVCLLRAKKLPSSLYVRVIKACRGCGLHGLAFVEELGELFARPDVDGKVRAEVEKVLLGGEMEECAAAGHPHYVSGIRKAVGVPEKVREKAGEILAEHAKRANPRPGIEPAKPAPSGIGAVDSRFRTHPSGRRSGLSSAEAAPTILVELKKATGKKG